MEILKANGIPIINYNTVIGESDSKINFDGKIYNGFYVSFNNHDCNIYGDVTTALVLGQMEKFFILNGDHTEAYKCLIGSGFFACMEYFKKNIDQMNQFSDR